MQSVNNCVKTNGYSFGGIAFLLYFVTKMNGKAKQPTNFPIRATWSPLENG